MMRLTTIIAALALMLPGRLPAQSDTLVFRIAPALLRPSGGDVTLAARLDVLAGSRRHDIARAFPSSRYWRAEGRGTLAIDPDANPDALLADFAGGLAISLAKPRVIDPATVDVDAPGSAMQFDYGDISVGGQLRLLSNQRASEVRASLGGEVVYTHDRQGGIWPFLPSVYGQVGLARSIRSELRDALGTPDGETYTRLEAGAAWHLSADRAWMPPPLRPVWLHAELNAYRDAGVEPAVEASGADEGTRIALAVAYRFFGERRRVLDELFLRWTDGETPTLPARRKAWMLGIVLAP
jgi:hypothetical protein